MRIVSLTPSATDIAVALGLADAVVGISHECDNTRTAGRPVVTIPHVPAAPETPPAEVDRAVSETKQSGRPLYETNMDLLRALDPDIVLAQDVCDVCAVPGRDVVAELPEKAKLVTLSATTTAGLEEDLLRVGEATETVDAAMGLIQRLRAIRVEVMGRIGSAARMRVLTLEWGDPPYVGGHWVPELVENAGGTHLLVERGDPSVRSDWAALAEADPDVVVFMPCGYRLGSAVDLGRTLVGRFPGANWWAVDASPLYSRCTPASVSTGLHVLAGIIHPDRCPAPSAFLAQELN